MSPAFGEGSAVRTIVTMDGNGRLAIGLRHQGEGIGAMLLKGAAERACPPFRKPAGSPRDVLPLICRIVGIGV